jgi:hypothetical protein
MAARGKKAARKTARRKTAGRQTGAALARLEQELPTNLRDFSRRVRRGLRGLEKEIGSARREAARLLRDASHALGRFEAEGDRRWRKLAAPPRREALRLLRRLERALEAPKPRKVTRKVKRRRVAAPTSPGETTVASVPPGRVASLQPSGEPS